MINSDTSGTAKTGTGFWLVSLFNIILISTYGLQNGKDPCSPGWPHAVYVQELLLCMLRWPVYWDDRHVPPSLFMWYWEPNPEPCIALPALSWANFYLKKISVCLMLGIKPRTLYYIIYTKQVFNHWYKS